MLTRRVVDTEGGASWRFLGARRLASLLALPAVLAALASHAAVVNLLPDIVVRADDLYDHDIDFTIEPGRRHLRLSNGTANVGLGPLHVYGVLPVNPDGTQDIVQRVWRSDGTYFDRPAGRFVHHPGHDHIHVENWCVYRIREVLAGGGVGAVVAEAPKTSFCILDLVLHDDALPNSPTLPQYQFCNDAYQGLSVGWCDVYVKTLPGQSIDVTDLPAASYWLESEVDPDGNVLESVETNNITRIQLQLGDTGTLAPDAYEPNDSRSDVNSRPPGGPNSPNLGPCGPQRTVSGLNIHAPGNSDYFKFYLNAAGAVGDFVRIAFSASSSDLALQLWSSSAVLLRASNGLTGVETISLAGLPAAWYLIRVYGFDGAPNPEYELTVDPSANADPQVTVTSPPEGNIDLVHGVESYLVTWTASDPDGDPTWVTVFANHEPVLDGNEQLLGSTVNTDGAQGFAVINTAELEHGTYWVYCAVTDGGTLGGSWSRGTVTLVEGPTAVAPMAAGMPPVARLLPAAPSPFNARTTLKLELTAAARLTWAIHDARGRRVRSLVEGWLPRGWHVLVWDGYDDAGLAVSSGVYYQVVESERLRDREKLLLIK